MDSIKGGSKNSPFFGCVLLLVSFLFAGCCNNSAQKSDAFDPLHPVKVYYATIDFQENYKDTEVRLTINGRDEFAGKLTSDDMLSVAKSLAIQSFETPDLEIGVQINGKSYTFNVDLLKGHFIGLYLNPQGELHLRQHVYPFIYV